MREYVVSVVAVSTLAALAVFISYGGASERAVKGAVSVILIYTLCMPIVDMVGDFSVENLNFELQLEDVESSSEYFETVEEAFTRGVKSYVCEEFGLDGGEVFVKIQGFAIESMRAERISIVLSGRAALSDVTRIAEAVKNAGLGECEVNIKID